MKEIIKKRVCGIEQTMTVKELSGVFEVSDRAIRRSIKRLYPNLMKHGKATCLNEDQTIKIKEDLKSHHNIGGTAGVRTVKTNKEKEQGTNNLQEPTNNLQVEMIKLFTKSIDGLNQTMKNIDKRLGALENTTTKQIEFKQDYYTIKGYSNLKNIRLSFSEAVSFGKEARRTSDALELEVRNVPDERFGKVNSYHIDVLERVFRP